MANEDKDEVAEPESSPVKTAEGDGSPSGLVTRRNVLLIALGFVGSTILDGIGGDFYEALKEEAVDTIRSWLPRSRRAANHGTVSDFLADRLSQELQAKLFGLHNGTVAITTGHNDWFEVAGKGVDRTKPFGGAERLPPFVASTAHEFEVAAGRALASVERVADPEKARYFDSEWHMGGPAINDALQGHLNVSAVAERLKYRFEPFRATSLPDSIGGVPTDGLDRYFHVIDQDLVYSKPTPAKVNSFLVAADAPETPIGPSFTDSGLLRSAPLILTILPKAGVRADGRVVLVQGSYGAPQSFDLLMDADSLGRAWSALGEQPFGQLLFDVPVEYRAVKKGAVTYLVEEYGVPSYVSGHPLQS